MAIRGRHRADEPLALALAGGATVAEAAATVGISERTAYRRLEDPDFRRLVHQTQARVFGAAVSKLCRLANDAADLLGSALEGAKAGTDVEVKLKAAGAVWEHVLKAVPLHNLLTRLEALERAGEGEDDDDGDAGEHDEAAGLPGGGPPPDEGEGVDRGADDPPPAEGGPGPDAEPLPVHPRRLADGPSPLFGGA